MKKIVFCLFMLGIVNKLHAIDINSESAIVMETSTKRVLFEKESHKEMAPASMTKIMTMLLVAEEIEKGNIKLEDKVVISKNAASMGGSQIFLEEGKSSNVDELFTSMAIGSANDAAVAMAEKIGGTVEVFVERMNKRAKELGCVHTNFKNPHGLDEEGHLTTSYDMALIASEAVKHRIIIDKTSIYETTITHENGNSIWLVNTNSLIKFYKGMDGLKTGFTDKAGYCLTGTINKNNMRLVSVVMNAKEKNLRNEDTINLMEYTYSMYSKHVIFKKNKIIGKIFINNSVDRKYNVYLKEDVNLILDKGVKDIDYEYDIEIFEVKAPLSKGSVVGNLVLNYNNQSYVYDLIVKENIVKSNYFVSMINYLKDIIGGNINIYNIK